jgi:hypothetical protein
MDPIAAEILRIGVSETAKVVFNKVLSKNWLGEFNNGRSIVEQLNSIDVHSELAQAGINTRTLSADERRLKSSISESVFL